VYADVHTDGNYETKNGTISYELKPKLKDNSTFRCASWGSLQPVTSGCNSSDITVLSDSNAASWWLAPVAGGNNTVNVIAAVSPSF